jgi:hypothetical protein
MVIDSLHVTTTTTTATNDVAAVTRTAAMSDVATTVTP